MHSKHNANEHEFCSSRTKHLCTYTNSTKGKYCGLTASGKCCWSYKILNTTFCKIPTGHQNEPTGASAEAVYVWNLSHTCCRQTASHYCALLPYDTPQNWDDSTTCRICHKDNLSQSFVPGRFEKLKCNVAIYSSTPHKSFETYIFRLLKVNHY